MEGLLVIAFGLGAVVGSFLNVVILRMNTGMTLGGRSMCMACGKTLTWKELIPIVSYFLQSGKCRKCMSKVSLQYPVVEILTGLLFVLILYRFPPVSNIGFLTTVIYLVVTSILIVIAVYDLKHKIIPDTLVYTFAIISFITLFIGGAGVVHPPHIWSILAGPMLALPFALLWAFSKGKWIGLGDAKLLLGIGWILGMNAGVNALILAVWAGAIVGLVWMFITYKKYKKGVEIPFGPFLILGMYLVLLGIQVIDLRILYN